MKQTPHQKLYLYKRIVRAKLFIDFYYAESIDLDKIAGKAFFSKFHFSRLFKKTYGRTPHDYLTSVRVENARKLLTKGASVAEVSLTVGFDSPTSFAALFKKNFNISPSEYRALHLKKLACIAENPLHAIPNCFAETHGWKNSNIQ